MMKERLTLTLTLTLTTALMLLTACGTKIPASFTETDRLPRIYPDYVDVTIPVNIAPLTFELDEEADEMIARYAAPDGAAPEIVCAGKMQPDIDEWRELIHSTLNTQHSALTTHHPITVDVYARHGDQWTHYKPFHINVVPDSIDPYLSYRLIQPSYVSYEALTISQRCLENYDESVIYDNMLCGFEKEGQCINCHSYQNYNPDRFQFHARQKSGGTVIAYDGKVKKVNMKNDSILSAGVYPAWHPWLKLIAYSTDKTHQSFHTTDANKVEVYDEQSDLIAYDIDSGEITNLENDPEEFEVFPAWAPDGKTLYYCSAHFERQDTALSQSAEVVRRAQELKYNIYKKSFDPDTKQFGPRELVFAADSLSAVLPRVSPDGRYLVFTVGGYGYFHIWHHDADLWMVDLRGKGIVNSEEFPTGVPMDSVKRMAAANSSLFTFHSSLNARPLTEANSPDTESYHTWSSNSRWLVFSSRRDDGVYTRPFFAYIGADGHIGKPFELPQADPDFHRQFLKCYNIPEFMRGPVTIAPQTFADVLKGGSEPVKYVRQLSQ